MQFLEAELFNIKSMNILKAFVTYYPPGTVDTPPPHFPSHLPQHWISPFFKIVAYLLGKENVYWL